MFLSLRSQNFIKHKRSARPTAGLSECRRVGDTSLPAPALLRRLKQIEREAGRRGGRPWGARTLDLDILDYKGLMVNWPKGNGVEGQCLGL